DATRGGRAALDRRRSNEQRHRGRAGHQPTHGRTPHYPSLRKNRGAWSGRRDGVRAETWAGLAQKNPGLPGCRQRDSGVAWVGSEGLATSTQTPGRRRECKGHSMTSTVDRATALIDAAAALGPLIQANADQMEESRRLTP